MDKVQKIIQHCEGGIYKRIDENRELLELIKREAPDFLRTHSWVKYWIKSQDEFLTTLADAVPHEKNDCSFSAALMHPDLQFPRNFPE